MAWQLVLEPTREEYPNLIVREFLTTHVVRPVEDNINRFFIPTELEDCPVQGLTLTCQAKTKEMLPYFKQGWEFLLQVATAAEFLIYTNWELVLDDKTISVTLSEQEQNVDIVYA